MEHKSFFNLSQEEQDIIYNESMQSDFDKKLSFGVISDGIMVGYALLKEECIANNLQIQNEPPFDKSSFACRILSIKEIYPERNLTVFPYTCKTLFDRVRIWNDEDKGAFSYIWFLTKNDGEANYISNIGNGESTKALESPNSISYLVYKKL